MRRDISAALAVGWALMGLIHMWLYLGRGDEFYLIVSVISLIVAFLFTTQM